MKIFKCCFALLCLAILVTLGYATFAQQAHGEAYAAQHIYQTWWFFALWTVLTLCSVLVLWRQQLWRRAAVCLLHVALLVILAGAAVTWLTAQSGQLHLRSGQTESHYLADALMQPLPFALRLDSFQIQYYPSTQAPQDFVSHVTIAHPAGGEETVFISMNHPLLHQGYRLYQTSFDPDQQGTLLTVRYDPYGTPITYTGYALLGLAMMWVLLSRKAQFRALLRQLRRMSVVLLLLSFAPLSTLHARSIPTISQAKAQRVARMQVVYNDRVCPFSTLAHDFTLKLYGKASYKGLQAEQVVYGWLASPETWKDEPMIRIKDAGLRRQLRLDSQYATLAQLFDQDGNYRLATMQPTKTVRELDEKVGLILMLTNGQLIQPLPPDATPLSHRRVEAEIFYNTIPFTKILFMVCFTLALLSFIPLLKRPAAVALYAVLAVHAASYALRWYISGRMPLANGYETMQFMALVLLVLAAVLQRRFSLALPFGFLLTGFTLLVSHLGQSNPQVTPLMPVLNSPLLSIHVCTIMMSYALLAFMMLNGLYALLTRSASDVRLLTISRVLLYPAVFLLAAGIFLGAVWANVSWGRYWSWDPKEVWALITLLVYAVPLHQQSIPLLRRPAMLHAYLVMAFLAVLMTYFGVNYFLGGMHSYA